MSVTDPTRAQPKELTRDRQIALGQVNGSGHLALIRRCLTIQGVNTGLLADGSGVRPATIENWLQRGQNPTIDQGARLRLFGYILLTAATVHDILGDQLIDWLYERRQDFSYGSVVSITAGDDICQAEYRLNQLLDTLDPPATT